MTPVLLLIVSNIFMTVAWYGHLRHTQSSMPWAIVVSWLIAFLEYCLQVPANRLGYAQGYSAYQLKIIQEVITLIVFVVFARFYLSESIKWNHIVAFGFLMGAVYFGVMPDKSVEKPGTKAEPELTKGI
jgi:uncharacterized protein